MRHAPSTIKSLVRRGWLEGSSYAVNVAMGDEKLSWEKATLWISAKGKTLLEEIAIESGWVFDEANYDVVRNRDEYRSIQAKGEEEMDAEKDAISARCVIRSDSQHGIRRRAFSASACAMLNSSYCYVHPCFPRHANLLKKIKIDEPAH